MNGDTSDTFDCTGLLSEEKRVPQLSTRALAVGLGVCAVALVLSTSVHIPGVRRYHSFVEEHALAKGLEPELVLAMISVESNGRKGAVSPKGAVGLMQILPSTAREIALKNGMVPPSHSDLVDPDTNIRLGVFYLDKLLGRYDNDLTLALAAYNAGPRRVSEWRSRYPDLSSRELCMKAFYPETRTYVAAVLARRNAMKRMRIVR